MGDTFLFIAVVAAAILMLGNLMQFTETEPGYDDLVVPGWTKIFNSGGNRFSRVTHYSASR